MNPTLFRIFFVLFLLAHGYIHLSLASVPTPQPGALRTPFFPSWRRAAVDPQWPASRLGMSPALVRTLGWVLWLLVAGLYTLAALALLFAPARTGLWQGFTAGASLLSLLLLALYWHPWLPVGVALDVALLAAIFAHWSPLQFA